MQIFNVVVCSRG